MAAFHATFSVALHFTGRFFSSEAPLPRGPRHCGQSEAEIDPPSKTTNTTASLDVCIMMFLERYQCTTTNLNAHSKI